MKLLDAHGIERQVSISSLGRIRDLQVEMEDDSVVLHGRTDTYYAKQLAQEGLRGVLPTARVVNAIVVV